MRRGPDSDDPDARATTDPDRRALPAASPDDIFADFVRRANADWVASVEAVLSELEAELSSDREGGDREGGDREGGDREGGDREGTDRIVLLTRPKSRPPPPAPTEDTVRQRPPDRRPARAAAKPADRRRSLARATEDGGWKSVVPERSQTTQRREAVKLVPDVASVPPPASPAPEGSEDGLMPSGELDRKLADMDVLVRYGHVPQVQSELEALRLGYPDDLLLLRRISELYVKHALRGPALEALFALATGLFERRNVEGMRQALEQVRVLDPENGRAARLLALLDQRPVERSPRR